MLGQPVQPVKAMALKESRALFTFLVRHAISRRAYATIMTFVRLSSRLTVMLVDCDHIAQQIVKISKWQDRSVSWLSACDGQPGS